MNRSFFVIMLVASCIHTLCSAATDSAQATETTGEFILNYQQQIARPMIDHCVSKVPELKGPLLQEHARFQANVREASSGLLQKLRSNGVLHQTVTPEIRTTFQNLSQQSLAEITKHDPESYCPWLLSSLRKATSESIKNSIEKAFAKYNTLSADKGAQSQ